MNQIFKKANLNSAILKQANLQGVNLHKAKFEETDLTECTFGETVLTDLYLATSKNLETCNHKNRSTIDLFTIQRSFLPKEFLQGCGLSDWEIESSKLYQGGLTPQLVTDIGYKIINAHIQSPIQYYSCFISYNHEDKEFAEKLHDALQKKGVRVWLDEHQMLPGDDIYEQIDRGIKHWDKVLLCCSSKSLSSWWVDNEIDTAFEKERRLFEARGKKIKALIPLNLDGYMFSDDWKSGKKQQVLSRIAGDFTEGCDFGRELDKLIKALTTDDIGREPPPEPKL